MAASIIDVRMYGGTLRRALEFSLRADPGSTLTRGTFTSGDRLGEGTDADFAEQNTSCANVRALVTDVAYSGSNLTRFDIKFWTNCSDASQEVATIFGEISYGEAQPSDQFVTGTHSIGWPATPVRSRAGATIPIWLRNTGGTATQVGIPALTGLHRSDFSIDHNVCPGTLAPGSSCSFDVAFKPQAAGVRNGAVSISFGDTNVATELSGYAPPGETFMRLISRPGDYIGEGKSYLFTDDRWPMHIDTGGPYGFRALMSDDTMDDDWSFTLFNRAAPMSLGSHDVDSWNDQTHYSLSIDGRGRGCNIRYGKVSISQLSFNSEGVPASFRATLTQHCETLSSPVLTGEISYRASPPVGYQPPGTQSPPTSRRTAPKSPGALKPKINLQPRDGRARTGGSVVLHATATGTPVPRVAWQLSRDHGHHWKTIKHAHKTRLRIAVTQRNRKYRYRAVFVNTAGTVHTRGALIHVNKRT